VGIRELPELRDRIDVFADRADAGRALARLVGELDPEDPVIVGIVAGGVPVAVALAEATGLPLDVAVVSKVTLPWNTEAGYGAVAFDGTTRLNRDLIQHVGLTEQQVTDGVAKTRKRVQRRSERMRDGGAVPEVAGRTVLLVDYGLASGFTMGVAVEAIRGAGAKAVAVTVPTGHLGAVERLSREADEVLCANIRGGTRFAVADAYRRWTDIPEVYAEELLRRHRKT